MAPEDRYADLVDELVAVEGVTPPQGGSGFGRGALRYQRKIFAMLVRGQLVVKLPEQRVDELVAAGHGDRFDANKGTPMREWFSLGPESALAWSPLAREALDFATASAPARRRLPGRPRARQRLSWRPSFPPPSLTFFWQPNGRWHLARCGSVSPTRRPPSPRRCLPAAPPAPGARRCAR
ncbi:MAG: hypothetical protein JOY82_17015 [Streptosporangiaceae bacterium]|nr:hypothetical protein [Streptosporangiaceae bacterium]